MMAPRSGLLASDPKVLDRALVRVSDLEFAPPQHFVNHGPMAIEALSVLGFDPLLDRWARRFEDSLVRGAEPAEPSWPTGFRWEDAVGESRLLPEWLGYFGQLVESEGWRAVVGDWVPRFMTGLQAALFHGVIRTAHAVRSIDTTDTPARRAPSWFGRSPAGRPGTGQDSPPSAATTSTTRCVALPRRLRTARAASSATRASSNCTA